MNESFCKTLLTVLNAYGSPTRHIIMMVGEKLFKNHFPMWEK